MSTGRLTTHVLDTGLGRPAAGLRIALYKIRGEARALLQEVVTNEGGRTDAALLSGPELVAGEYELVFHAGDYLRTSGQAGAGTLFLDKVPVRFGISDPGMHIHVPLLLSPYGYSTYRGS